jgi:hypothetical protein
MDDLNEVLGATIDGTRLNPADGLLRLVLHRLTDEDERHWEVYLKGVTELHLERTDAGKWNAAEIRDLAVTEDDDGARVRLSLSDDLGVLDVVCAEIEVIPMGRVELA